MLTNLGAAPDRGQAMRRTAREFICALTVVVLLLGAYLGNILRGRNALWFLWQPGDAVVLLGMMGALAGIAVTGREFARRYAPSILLRVVDHGFVLALGAGLLTNLWFHTSRPTGYRISQYGMEMQTAWLLLFALVGYSLASKRSRVVLRARQLCCILSPVALIVAVQLVRLPTLAEPMSPLAESATAKAAQVRPVYLHVADKAAEHPVYLLILDEWSYTRTYDGGRLRPEFRNLAVLSEHATTYLAARSPGPDTAMSIPAICRQTSDLPEIQGLQAGFRSGGRWRRACEYPSIFAGAGCSDYRKIMVHWGYALSLWLQDELDTARAYPCYPRAKTPVGQALLHVYNAAFYWTDPWSALVYEKLQTRVKDAHALDLYEQVHRDLLTILRDEPARTFAIVHYPLPHYPYVLNPDGSYRGLDARGWDKSNLEGYRRNLACMDYIVGEVVTTLKAAGRYDDCTLILTADHSWRNDPEVPEKTHEILTHVPLIVKLPGQHTAGRVEEDFRTFRLGELIAKGLKQSTPGSSLAITYQDDRSVAAAAGQVRAELATPTTPR
jgi:hypothetical protein